MSSRVLWHGYLTFAMVTIPIQYHTSAKAKDLRFRNLHNECGKPIERRWFCGLHDRIVSDEELTKAFEMGSRKNPTYIPMTEEELSTLPNEGNRILNILRFVDAAAIDPINYESTYYLAPEMEGRKPFRLLNRVLAQSQKVGLGTVVLRDKENIAVVRPYGNSLAFSTLYYTDEVKSIEEELDLGQGMKLSDAELNMGVALVNTLSGEANLGEFKDRYREKVMEIIQAKAEGRTFTLPAAEPAPESTMDLAKALEASLKAMQK